MAGNSRPIEAIEKDDFVLARNEHEPNGPLELKRVLEKFVRTAPVMELWVRPAGTAGNAASQCIKTTAEHPFFVPSLGQFIPAGQLQPSDLLISHDDRLIEVTAAHATGEITTVYNLHVADHHTYFVGGDVWGFSVWVHNTRYEGAELAKAAEQVEDLVSNRTGVARNIGKGKETIVGLDGRVYSPDMRVFGDDGSLFAEFHYGSKGWRTSATLRPLETPDTGICRIRKSFTSIRPRRCNRRDSNAIPAQKRSFCGFS